MNLYFFVSEPFGEGQFKRHGLSFLERKNIGLRVVNLLLLSEVTYTNEEVNRFKTTGEKNQLFCDSTEDVWSILRKLKPNDVILYHIATMHWKRFSFVLKYLNQNKIRYGFMRTMAMPNITGSKLKKIISFCEMHSTVFQKVFRKLLKEHFYHQFNPSFIITAGNAVFKENKTTYGSNPKYFNTESIDSLKARQLNQKLITTLRNKKYFVYIEQGNPFHPDLKLIKTLGLNFSDDYYNKTNDFLSEMERKTGTEAIVSLPPKTKMFMPQLINEYKNRQFFVNYTPELVKYCQFVVIQYSTAINFAVIFKKPIFFVSLDNKGYVYNAIKALAKVFEKEVIMTNDKFWVLNKEEVKEINFNIYKAYENNWINSKGALPLSKNILFLKFLQES